MNDRKLLLFSYDFPPSDGGIARLCHEIAIGSKNEYDEVIVLTRQKTGNNIPYNSGELKIIELPGKRIYCELAALKFLISLKNKQQYDVICGLWHPEATLALLSGFKRVFTLAHGTELLYGASKFRKLFWLPFYAKIILQKSTKIIANSRYTAELVKIINKNSAVYPLPLAVNHLFFKPIANLKDETRFTLCSVSRIQQFKGHDFVIKVIASLPEFYKRKILYFIAGTGTYLDTLKGMVVQLELSKQVIFSGFVPDEQLPSFYNKADVFILCTRETPMSTQMEGFGLVFLETQACGIPAIGTNTGGIPDAIYHDNGGWLIEQDSFGELTTLLIKLIDNMDIVKEMGKKARIRVEKEATWKNYCTGLFNLIREI